MRRTIGYERWATEQELVLLESTYDNLWLSIDFFQPPFILMAKERIGKQTIKRYDPAKAPCPRVLERKDIPLENKAQLINVYMAFIFFSFAGLLGWSVVPTAMALLIGMFPLAIGAGSFNALIILPSARWFDPRRSAACRGSAPGSKAQHGR